MLKTIKEWLYDYYATIQGTQMEEILHDVLPREVESFSEARRQVNHRITMMMEWLNGTRPTPSLVYEPEAWTEWVENRKATKEKL